MQKSRVVSRNDWGPLGPARHSVTFPARFCHGMAGGAPVRGVSCLAVGAVLAVAGVASLDGLASVGVIEAGAIEANARGAEHALAR